ncbi:MAG: response regulator [Nitrospirota bacterium]|nr:response regulator [Nitrospirota bacterium]
MAELQRVLYVEDEADIRTIARLSLEAVGGMTVCLCASGAEAVEAAVSFRPELILLDVMMPGMDGPTTLRALRAVPELASVPVAFMTAKVQPAELDNYRSMGAVDVITKPFDPMTLPDRLRAIWRGSGS